MDIGRIVGKTVCTVKQESMGGLRLCLVQIPPEGENSRIVVASDAVQAASEGALVYLIDGSEAADSLRRGKVPVDLSVVGLVEHYGNHSQGRQQSNQI